MSSQRKKSLLSWLKNRKVVSIMFGIIFFLISAIMIFAIPSPTKLQTFLLVIFLALGVVGFSPLFMGDIRLAVEKKEYGSLVARGTFAIFLFIIIIWFVSEYYSPPPAAAPTAAVSPGPEPSSTPRIETPIETPMVTHTQTLHPTDTHTPQQQACLLKEIWHTNIPNPPFTSTEPQQWLLQRWGFYDENRNGTSGVAIVRNADDVDINGISQYLYERQNSMKFSITADVTIQKLITAADCEGDVRDGTCSASLVIGIGNPLGQNIQTENGRYIVFRDLDGTDGWICKTQSLYGYSSICVSPLGSTIEEMVAFHIGTAYTIQFDINGNLLNAKLSDGRETINYYSNEILPSGQVDQILWIGYHFRSSGEMDAFISCPVIEG
jgi:hypothetical protein